MSEKAKHEQELPRPGFEARPVERLETGIEGLDELLGGGLGRGRPTLVTGGSGCGKTFLLNEFLYRGITRFEQNGVFVTFEERRGDIIRNVAGAGWDYPTLIAEKRLAIVDLSQSRTHAEAAGKIEWEVLVERIGHAVKETGAQRVAVDSLGSAIGRYSNLDGVARVRTLMFRIMDELKDLGVTSLVSAEKPTAEAAVSRYGVEEFVSDAVLDLTTSIGQNMVLRWGKVVKMRGLSYRSGAIQFEIMEDGIRFFPKIPVDTSTARTEFNVRMSTGEANLDEALSGGIPQGHMVLVAGNTGTGKTLLGMQFLLAGLAAGESAIWVALEEPIPQILKTAEAHGWDLATPHKDGRLAFVRAELLDVNPDKLLYRIVDAAEATGARRVVIDSVSSLESSTMDRDQVREFLIQASSIFKSRGACCIMNYLSAESFGAAQGQLLGSLATNEMRLSSIVDAIILLRYVERENGVRKLLNVLKLRGSNHIRDILQYDIFAGGLKIGQAFAAPKS